MHEIAIDWIKGSKRATVSAYSSSKIKGKMLKLKEKYPDEVDYIVNEDGSLCGHVPIEWVKINPPKQVSEEQREKARERFAKVREAKNGSL